MHHSANYTASPVGISLYSDRIIFREKCQTSTDCSEVLSFPN